MPAGRRPQVITDILTARREWREGKGSFPAAPSWCGWCGNKRAYRHLPSGYICEPCAEGGTR